MSKEIKSCRGCKHLVHTYIVDACSAGDTKNMRTRIDWFSARVMQFYGLRPELHEARAEGGICGPEARLYEPRWSIRLWRRLSEIWSRS